MTNDRSREPLGPGQQIYTEIGYCSDARTLWGKIASGRYDWLGVVGHKGKRTYVVGSPAAPQGSALRMSGVALHGDVPPDNPHRATLQTPEAERWGMTPFVSSWLTADKAREDFERSRSECLDQPGSGLWRAQLWEGSHLIEEDLIVKTLPNVL